MIKNEIIGETCHGDNMTKQWEPSRQNYERHYYLPYLYVAYIIIFLTLQSKFDPLTLVSSTLALSEQERSANSRVSIGKNTCVECVCVCVCVCVVCVRVYCMPMWLIIHFSLCSTSPCKSLFAHVRFLLPTLGRAGARSLPPRLARGSPTCGELEQGRMHDEGLVT